jgi:ricin-type beta-trefoil lectin protein
MRLRKEGTRPVRRAFAGRRLGVALATAGVLALSLTSAVAASPAANAAPFPWMYENAEHLTCLSSGGVDDGTARAYNCTGSANQVWHYGGVHGAYTQLINNGTGQCLGVYGASTSAGARVVVWSCDGYDDQYWLPDSNAPGVIDFVNQNSQMVIQIACNCGTNGATIDQEPASGLGSPNQLWYPLEG